MHLEAFRTDERLLLFFGSQGFRPTNKTIVSSNRGKTENEKQKQNKTQHRRPLYPFPLIKE